MGFYVTGSECECREKTHPPSKNRVWDFFATSHTCAGQNVTFAQYPRPENEPTPTATASGARYYGYRFYSPALGRWINRDPIEEQGGSGLYRFVRNDPVDVGDLLGLMGSIPPSGGVYSDQYSMTIPLHGGDLYWRQRELHVQRFNEYLEPRAHGVKENMGQTRYFISHFGDPKIEKVNSCCAKVVKNRSALLQTQIAVIDPRYVGTITTWRGWTEVVAHENRHSEAAVKGALAYYVPVVGTGWAAVKCGTVCDQRGYEFAADKLKQYLFDVENAAWQQMDHYFWVEAGNLDNNEGQEYIGNLFDHHTRIYHPRTPAPFDQSKLPKCPSGDCK